MVARYKSMDSPAVTSFIGVPAGLQPVSPREQPYATIHAQFVDATASAKNWMDGIDNASALLERTAREEPEIAYYFLEQSAAINVVGQAVLTDKLTDDSFWTEEHLQALGHHVDILIKNHNPQAMIIAPALKRLEGYWPQAKIQEASRMAANSSEAWMNKNERRDEAWHIYYYDRLNKEAASEMIAMVSN